MKKLTALLLALALLLSLGTLSALAEQKLEEITILYPGEESEEMTKFLKGPFAEKMAKELNLKVNIQFLSWANYWDQKSIMLAANQPIDLYWDGLPSLSEMVNKKEAQPLDDLIKEYWGEEIYKVLPQSQLDGGKIGGVQYGIPSAYAPSSGMFQFVCVRQDLLEAVGMSEIKNDQDLLDYATKVMQQFPEFKGPADVIFKPLTRNFGDEVYFWVASQDLVVFGEETAKAYSFAETTAFERVARFNRELYLDGIYSDDLTIKYNERDSRFQTGLYIWLEGSLGKDVEQQSLVKANDPTAVLGNYLLAPEKPRYINAAGGEVLCVPYSAPNPSGALRFLQWMWGSQENYLFLLYGVEGQDWKLDENGRLVTISQTAGGEGYFYEWMFRNANYQVFRDNVSDEFIETYKNWDNEAVPSKMLGFAFNNSGLESVETACNEAFNKLNPILYGYVDFDSEYPAAIKALKDAGIDQYVAEINRQLEEFMAKK